MATKKELRLKLIGLLGGQCKVCGNLDLRVLQLDHINPKTKLKEKEIGDRRTIMLLVMEGILPLDRFQVLCANCNWIKRVENNEEY